MPGDVCMRLTRTHALRLLGWNVSVHLLEIDGSPESVCDVCGPNEAGLVYYGDRLGS